MAGRSGENGGAGGGDLSEPLLGKEAPRRYSELYGAGVLSRLSFSWLNPLLRLGRSKALDLADVPLIASEDGAARASERFAEAWSLHGHGKDGGGGGRLVGVLLRCFLGEIMLTGFYALVKTLAIAVSSGTAATRQRRRSAGTSPPPAHRRRWRWSARCWRSSSPSRCRSGTGSSARGGRGCASGRR